ncbi:MAG TPA: tetratricopeptide repeat protein [Patescibacteria group bacterium]|nr:tetratricopeptide repeat protein [Patescibacteria group bacterium]
MKKLVQKPSLFDLSLKTFVVFSLLLLLLPISVISIRDTDLWWHVRAGEVMWQLKTIPQFDLFSYPIENLRWLNWQWLGDVILYGVFHFFQVNGIIIFKTVFAGLTLLTLLFFAKKLKLPFLFSIVLLALILVTNGDRYLERPEMFSHFLFVITLGSLILYTHRPHRFVFFFPLLFLVWANLHPAFLVGLVTVWIFISFETLKRFLSRKFSFIQSSLLSKKSIRTLWIVTILSTLSVLINPYTYEIFIAPFKHLSSDSYMARTYEWMSPFSWAHRDSLYVVFFVIVALLYLFGFFLSAKKVNITFLALSGALFFLAYQQTRQIPYFTLGGFLPFLLNLDTGIFQHLPQKKRPVLKTVLSLLIGSFFLISSWYLIQNGYILGKERRTFGLGIKDETPTNASRFLDEAGITGNMYNHYGIGGYLIFAGYPNRLVFMDGRAHYPTSFFDEYIASTNTKEKLHDVIEKYNITYFVLEFPTESKSTGFAAEFLSEEDSGFALVYWDNYALVYLKKIPENEPILSQYAYLYADPLKLLDQNFNLKVSVQAIDEEILQGVYRELRRTVITNPKATKAILFWGSLLEAEGKEDLAVMKYQQVLTLEPENAVAHTILGKRYLRQGNLPEAEKELKQAIFADPRLSDARHNLGMVYIATKQYTQAETEFKKAVSIRPDYKEAYLALGMLYAENLNKKERAKKMFQTYLSYDNESPYAQVAKDKLKTLQEETSF